MTLTQYKQKSELKSLGMDKRRKMALAGIAIFILLGLVIAYQPVMFNFLCSDDFYIVSWLDACKQNTALLFQAVYEGTPYYRPVLNLCLYLEYLLCGANGFHFRLVSIVYLLMTAGLLWSLVSVFANSNDDDSNKSFTKVNNYWAKSNWALFTVGFFLLFPLHTEPVDWFVSTTELLANIFILSSFLSFIYWRNKKLVSLQLISYLLATCAFLTKEIAVILPAILFSYEFLIKQSTLASGTAGQLKKIDNSDSGEMTLSKITLQLMAAMKITAGYWLLLVMYLCLRKVMTGNFLGNWSNAVFHFTSNKMMIDCWWQSIKMILSPISSAAFGNNLIVRIAWLLMLADLTFLSLAVMYKDPKKRALLIFLISWFFICLLPMAKLLLITPDLLDARYGYIASVPLCIFLMFGLALRNRPNGLNVLRYPVYFTVLAFCCFVLRANNLAWAETGKLTVSMLEGFRSIHKQKLDDTKLYFINIPLKNNGVAIAGLKSIDSMNHIPFADTNHDNCVWLLDEDQSLPLGLMSSDLKTNKIKARFYYLNRLNNHFYPVRLFTSNQNEQGETLGIARKSESSDSKLVFLPSNLKCQDIDALVFKFNIKRKVASVKDGAVKLNFSNTVKSERFMEESMASPVLAKEGQQTAMFMLRGRPSWLFGGICHSLELTFPKGLAAHITEAEAISIENAMPRLKIQNDRYDNSSGQVNLNPKHSQVSIKYDCSLIRDCAGIKIEIIKASDYFSELNSRASNTHSLVDLCVMKPVGQILIDKKMLSDSGDYKVRLCPIDNNGVQCGFCSDHFLLDIVD